MKLSAIDPETLSVQQITRLLDCGRTEQPKPGDCIFVFGAPPPWGNERVETAATLFRAQKAPYLLLTGGVTASDARPEAEEMRDHALRLGVPGDAILIENRSTNTLENVLRSAAVLERHLGIERLKRLLVVTTAFHMRRALLTLRTSMPESIEIAGCPVQASIERMVGWWETPWRKARVMTEVRNLVAYVRAGDLLDVDVEI